MDRKEPQSDLFAQEEQRENLTAQPQEGALKKAVRNITGAVGLTALLLSGAACDNSKNLAGSVKDTVNQPDNTNTAPENAYQEACKPFRMCGNSRDFDTGFFTFLYSMPQNLSGEGVFELNGPNNTILSTLPKTLPARLGGKLTSEDFPGLDTPNWLNAVSITLKFTASDGQQITKTFDLQPVTSVAEKSDD